MEQELSEYDDRVVEDYEDDLGYMERHHGGPDIIDSMKPTFYFNVKSGASE